MQDFDFVPDHSIEAPAALDPAIASCSMRAISNRFADGFDVEVAASFGKERIRFQGEEFSGTAFLSMRRALATIQLLGCRLELKDPATSEEQNPRFVLRSQNSTQFLQDKHSGLAADSKIQGSLDSSVDASVSLKADKHYKSGSNAENSVREEREWTKNWNLLGENCIRVGITGTTTLMGEEVVGARPWRMFPNANLNTAAVVLRLTTREDWIDFEDIMADSLTGRVGRKVKSFLGKSKKKQELELFNELLSTLVARGLSAEGDEDATLAGSVLVLRKIPDEAQQHFSAALLPAPTSTRLVTLDAQAVEKFIDLPPPARFKFVEDLRHKEAKVRTSHDTKPYSVREKFRALSSPHQAVNALKWTASVTAKTITEWDNEFSAKTRYDLETLTFVFRSGDKVVLHEGSRDPRKALVSSARRAPILQEAERLLESYPDLSPERLVELISANFDLDQDGGHSRTETGKTLMQWVRFINDAEE